MRFEEELDEAEERSKIDTHMDTKTDWNVTAVDPY